MKVAPLFRFLLLCVCLASFHCQSSLNSSNFDSSASSDLNEFNTDLEVGTITGNPSTKPTQKLFFQTTSDTAQEETDVAVDYSYCSPFWFDGHSFLDAMTCNATPHEYNLGILEITLVQCQSNTAEEIPCSDAAASNVTLETSIFNPVDTIQHLNIGDVESDLSLDNLQESEFQAGGMYLTLAFIEQKIPDQTSNAYEASKFSLEFQGVSYRICTSSQSLGSELIEEYCGQSQARFGDVLWDTNGDGEFSFIHFEAGNIEETPTRPAHYNSNNVLPALSHVTKTHIDKLIPDSDHLRLLIGFDEEVTVFADNDFSAKLAFNISNTFRFIDGHVAVTKCLMKHDLEECQSISNDADTQGVYDPMFDSFLPAMPKINVSFD